MVIYHLGMYRLVNQLSKDKLLQNLGNTGHSQGPHLHITIREGAYKGIPVNPNKYFNY